MCARIGFNTSKVRPSRATSIFSYGPYAGRQEVSTPQRYGRLVRLILLVLVASVAIQFQHLKGTAVSCDIVAVVVLYRRWRVSTPQRYGRLVRLFAFYLLPRR